MFQGIALCVGRIRAAERRLLAVYIQLLLLVVNWLIRRVLATKYTAEEGDDGGNEPCDGGSKPRDGGSEPHSGRDEPRGDGLDGRSEPCDGCDQPLDETLDRLNHPLDDPLEEAKCHGQSVVRGFTVRCSSLLKGVCCLSGNRIASNELCLQMKSGKDWGAKKAKGQADIYIGNMTNARYNTTWFPHGTCSVNRIRSS